MTEANQIDRFTENGLHLSSTKPTRDCFIVAEVSQAHDGSLGMAHAFIDAVAKTGADAVKFQTHIAAAESTPGMSCPDGSLGGTICVYTLPSLVAGASKVGKFTVRAGETWPAGSSNTITNTVSIGDDGANGPDVNPANNADSAPAQVIIFVDNYVVKTDGARDAVEETFAPNKQVGCAEIGTFDDDVAEVVVVGFGLAVAL